MEDSREPCQTRRFDKNIYNTNNNNNNNNIIIIIIIIIFNNKKKKNKGKLMCLRLQQAQIALLLHRQPAQVQKRTPLIAKQVKRGILSCRVCVG